MQRRHGLVALLVLAALALGYFGGRAHAPATDVTAAARLQQDATISTKGKSSIPLNAAIKSVKTVHAANAPALTKSAVLPPPGTPLKQTFTELQARAEAGDAAAASRWYQDAQRCAEVRRINETAKRMLGENVQELTPPMLQFREQTLGTIQKDLDFAHDNAALCADLSDEQIASVVPASMLAAQLGDSAAADCYVGADLIAVPGVLDHPEWISAYKDNALAIADAAIQNGDWTMVGQMQHAYANNLSSLLGQLTGSDPLQNYRYLKLWRMGMASDKDMRYFDKQLAQAIGEISPDQQRDADAWAQDMYQRYFSANPQNRAQGNMNICQTGAR